MPGPRPASPQAFSATSTSSSIFFASLHHDVVGHLRLGEQHVHVPRHASRDRVDPEAHGLAEVAQVFRETWLY